VKPLLQWKVNKCYTLSDSICSLRYPAWNGHAPYCHLWPVWLYLNFPHYILIYQSRRNVTQFISSGNCSTWFGWYHHPSSGAQTTVSTASGICHTVTAICRYRGRVGTGLSVLWVAVRSSISSTVAASSSIGWQYLTLYVQLCAPDNGRRNRLKHVERL